MWPVGASLRCERGWNRHALGLIEQCSESLLVVGFEDDEVLIRHNADIAVRILRGPFLDNGPVACSARSPDAARLFRSRGEGNDGKAALN
jgi:hypothetical protein